LEEEWCVGEVEEDDEVCVLLAMVDVLGDCNVFVVVVVAVEDDDEVVLLSMAAEDDDVAFTEDAAAAEEDELVDLSFECLSFVDDDDDFLVVVVVVARGDFSTSTIVAVGVEDVAGVDEGGDAEKERREEEDVLGDVSFFCNG